MLKYVILLVNPLPACVGTVIHFYFGADLKGNFGTSIVFPKLNLYLILQQPVAVASRIQPKFSPCRNGEFSLYRKLYATEISGLQYGIGPSCHLCCIVLYLYLFKVGKSTDTVCSKTKRKKKKKIKNPPLVTLYRYRFPVSGQPRDTL